MADREILGSLAHFRRLMWCFESGRMKRDRWISYPSSLLNEKCRPTRNDANQWKLENMRVRNLFYCSSNNLGTFTLGVCLFFLVSFTNGVWAGNVLVSGQLTAATIDIDGDGPIEAGGPDPDDCSFSIFSVLSQYQLTPVQVPITLRICTGIKTWNQKSLGQDSSSDFSEGDLSTVGTSPSGGAPPFPALSGYLTLPYEVELVSETAPLPPDGLPLEVNQIRIEDPPGDENLVAMIQLCDAGGPAAHLQLIGTALALQIDLVPYPNAATPTHYMAQSLPFERIAPNQGTSSSHDVYFPVTNGAYTVAEASTPNDLLINMDMHNLPSCRAAIAIPLLHWKALVIFTLILGSAAIWGLARIRTKWSRG